MFARSLPAPSFTGSTFSVTLPSGDVITAKVYDVVDAVADPELGQRLLSSDPASAINRVRGADGAEVVFSYRVSKEAAHELAERTGAHPVQADLGNRDDLSRLFSETERLLPHLDILVNNAGGGRPGEGLVEPVDHGLLLALDVVGGGAHRSVLRVVSPNATNR